MIKVIQVNIGCIDIKTVYQAGSVNIGTTLNFVQRPQPQGEPPLPPTRPRRPRRPRVRPPRVPRVPKPEPTSLGTQESSSMN
ncbi:hypothetical protein EDD58_11072 [Hazenella coriacea]|uniref:Uncharacterized protein n=1 Tax=Hazenella coriacea TaxID=1179467 RepID=A0A4R3L1J4_9BACL|nr:hypothetical protein EDD58_11072 [Hazenella coriacea]